MSSSVTKKGTNFNGHFGYANEQASFHLGAKANYDDQKFRSVHSSLVFQYPENVSWGFSGLYKFNEKPYVLSAASAVQLNNANAHAALTKKQDLYSLAFSWFHQLSGSVSYASNFTVDANAPVDQVKGTTAGIAGAWKLDDDTTLRGKWSVAQKKSGIAEMRVGLATEQRVSTHAVATIGADINATKFLGNSNSKGKDHKFGFKLDFE